MLQKILFYALLGCWLGARSVRQIRQKIKYGVIWTVQAYRCCLKLLCCCLRRPRALTRHSPLRVGRDRTRRACAVADAAIANVPHSTCAAVQTPLGSMWCRTAQQRDLLVQLRLCSHLLYLNTSYMQPRPVLCTCKSYKASRLACWQADLCSRSPACSVKASEGRTMARIGNGSCFRCGCGRDLRVSVKHNIVL